ncbi:MAG: COX15/CtaA family protein [Candidatus Acidiferrales bacterium]
MGPNLYNKPLHWFAVFSACLTVVLVTAGALVTSNDAGLSIPDWPLAYNSLVPPFVGGIRFEFTHRVIAACEIAISLIFAVWLWRAEPRKKVRNFGWIAVGAVIGQAILGGMTVIFRQPVWISVSHATLAQLFFCAMVSLALFTSKWWWQDVSVMEDTRSPRVRTLAAFTAVATLLQLVLGAEFRHKGLGIGPHLVGAAVVTGMIFWTAGAIRRRFPNSAALTRCRIVLHALIGTQLLLGAGAWWSRISTQTAPQPMPVMIGFTVAHVVVGALTLAGTVGVALVTNRLLRHERLTAVSASHAQEAI